jgi:hypothetical protein
MILLVWIAQLATFAVPAALAWRGWDRRKGIALGWAIIVLVVQTVTMLTFLYPRAFGLSKDQVHIPDAPDVLPTGIMALLISVVSFSLGKTLRFAVKRS